jgi:zinc transporter ZupT
LRPEEFPQTGLTAAALATIVGWAGAGVGVWLTELRRRARLVVPFSAGVLLGVAGFGLAPELASEMGWAAALGMAAAGYGLLLAINRYAYAVCPTCAHDHDHASCTAELHGFAAPLIGAAALHSFLDGWNVTTALHKIPEGVALGGILRAALGSRGAALGWCLLAEGATLVGGFAGLSLAPHLGSRWISYPLGFTAGWLFYLGWHAVHEEWKSRGARPAFLSALTGIAGAAIIQRGAEALFR